MQVLFGWDELAEAACALVSLQRLSRHQYGPQPQLREFNDRYLREMGRPGATTVRAPVKTEWDGYASVADPMVSWGDRLQPR